ncbi:MAG: NAD(P)/FAD-dependent oxidoreductase [Chloroflexi bacterium]|nr:NAD(P)/FAD-dependent oxidoreductase [Chloroflexota bacterium]
MRRGTGLIAALIAIAMLRVIRGRLWPRQDVRRTTMAAPAPDQPARRIVIVGIGFAGLAALGRLKQLVGGDAQTEVLAVDRRNYHLFTPLLYQVATGGVEPGLIAYPARRIARDHRIRFMEAVVDGVDLARHQLDTDAGPIAYDALILAPGSVPNFFGMADAEQYALPLKWIRDGMRIHDRVINAFEQADRETDRDRRQMLLTFVIVGGGATGVELAASLSDLVATLLPHYPSIRSEEVRLLLIEARDALLPGWNPRMGQRAARQLLRHHVELLLGTMVSRVTDAAIETAAGQRIPTATVIWTAGVRPEPLVDLLPGPKLRDGRVRVDRYLALPGYPGVFIAGDAAAMILPTMDHPLPPTARAAIESGRAAAENAVRYLAGQPLLPFEYRVPGELVSLGRGAAAADIRGVVFDGLPGWLIRRGVYLTNLVGFRNRLFVILEWLFVTFRQRAIASFTEIPGRRRAAAPSLAPAAVRARAREGDVPEG